MTAHVEPCPICGAAGRHLAGAALLDAVCTVCGWYYPATRRPSLRRTVRAIVDAVAAETDLMRRVFTADLPPAARRAVELAGDDAANSAIGSAVVAAGADQAALERDRDVVVRAAGDAWLDGAEAAWLSLAPG